MLLKLCHAQCHDRCPGEPVPVPDHPAAEEPFPNTQTELPMLNVRDVPLGPVTAPESRDQCLPLHSPCEEAVGNNEAFPQPPLLWAE